MTYQQALDYLYSQLPMFHRIGAAAYKADLNNTIAICKMLRNPERKFRAIHVAGTNGKGSVSHMLASVLQTAGFKTGLYTSPHLKDFRERIRVNGQMISKDSVCAFVNKHRKAFDRIQPSFFEWTVGLAFDHFAKEKVDIAIVEVGLGGRLDSTNVVSPLVSVITNISYDHEALLGNTVQKIAAEKAGIVKKKVPVVVGEKQKEVASVFSKKAKEMSAPLVFASEVYQASRMRIRQGKLWMDIKKGKELFMKDIGCELKGMYQGRNVCTVMAVLEVLEKQGITVSKPELRRGLLLVTGQTGLLGRWQVLSRRPLMIADTGHNEAGIREVLDQVKKTRYEQLHFVFGAVNDKAIDKILKLLPKEARYYFCKASIPRALDESELAKQASKAGLKGKAFSSVKEAFQAAKKAASPRDLVLVGGSTFVVAEVL